MWCGTLKRCVLPVIWWATGYAEWLWRCENHLWTHFFQRGRECRPSDIGFYSLTGIAEKYPELAAQMGITLLDEADESFVLDTSVPYVAVKRTMKPFVWNTFCAPFDMSADELAANGITSVKSLGAVRRTNGKVLLTFKEETGMKSGVPYIVKVADGVTELNIDAPKNVTTAPAEQDAIGRRLQ